MLWLIGATADQRQVGNIKRKIASENKTGTNVMVGQNDCGGLLDVEERKLMGRRGGDHRGGRTAMLLYITTIRYHGVVQVERDVAWASGELTGVLDRHDVGNADFQLGNPPLALCFSPQPSPTARSDPCQ